MGAYKGWSVVAVAAIYAVVKAYDALNESVEETKEKAESLLDEYNLAIEKANSNKKSIEDVAEKYETLSKGVGNLGENLSLTTEEYEEYNSIVNQIAEMFPKLVQGYTNEGNAILSLKGNVEELIDAYKEAQQEAYNLLIVGGKDSDGNDIISNYQNQINGNESFLSTTSSHINGEGGAVDAIDIISRLTGALTPEEFRETYDELYKEYENVWNSDKIQNALNSSGFKELTNGDKWSKITTKDLENVKHSAQATIQTYKAEIDSQLKNVQTLANAYLMTNEDYAKLDEETQKAASIIVNSINENIANGFKIKEDVGAYVSSLLESILEYPELQDDLIGLFTTDFSNMSIQDAAIAVNEYIDRITEVLEEDSTELKIRLGFDDYDKLYEKYSNTIDFTNNKFNVSNVETILQDLQNNLQNEYNKIQDWGLGDYEEKIKNGTIQSVFGNVDMDKRTIIEWSDELKKTYQEELASWEYDPEVGGIDTVFGGSDRFGEDINGTGWEVAFTPILPDGTFLNKDAVYDYINNILVEAYSDDGKVTEEELKKIDAQGRQVGNTFVQGIFAGIDESQNYENNGNWAETVGRLMHFSGDYGSVSIAEKAIEEAKKLEEDFDWDNWFEENSVNTQEEIDRWLEIARAANSATEAIKRYGEVASDELSFTKQMQGIHGLSEGLDQLDAIMADIIDGETFDYSSILDPEGNFAKTFNVSGLTEEYEALIKAVTNSPNDLSKCQQEFNDLATAYIHSKNALSELSEETRDAAVLDLKQMGVKNAEEVVDSYLELDRAKDEIVNAGYDLVNITNEEAIQFMNLSTASETAKKYLFAYQVQKSQINNNPIDTIAECNQLYNLASAAGYTGSALLYLAKIKALLNKIENDKLDESSLGYKSVMGQITQYNGLLQQVIGSEIEAKKVTVDFGNGAKSAAAAQKNLADATDKATDALEKQKEALEEQKSEYEELHDAIIWFYDEQIEAIDDKIDAINEENEALEKQLDNMDDIIKAIEDNYDIEIQKIQDKIDALQDENDEEERALKLEEAKRKLQEAKSRKTILQYEKGKGFVYTVDTNAIKEAEEELEGLQDEEIIHQLEKEIEKLEEAKQKWSEIPEAYDKAMRELAAKNYFGSDWRTTTLFPSDELLNAFKGEYTGIQGKIDENEKRIEKLEEEKAYLEDLKELWEDAIEEYENQQKRAKLASFFGSDYEYQLLNNSAVWRRQFVSEYSAICAEIEALEERIKTANDNTTSSATSNAEKTKTAYSETATAVEDSVTRIQQSQNEIGIELEDIAGTTKEIVDEAYLKALEINTIISILDLSIGSLKARIDTLYGTLQQMDEITLSNVIAAFGGAGGSEEGSGEGSGSKGSSKGSGEKGSSGGSGLLAAVEAVSDAIGESGEGGEGGTGLLGLLDQVDNKTLENIIGQFGSEGEDGSVNASSLLNAVNTVSDAIAGEGKEDSLISCIDQLATDSVEPIQNVTTEFGTLLDKINECITQVEELATKIANLDASKLGAIGGVQIGLVNFKSSGTAHTFGSGTAHGSAYSSGTGKWGLAQDEPGALVGELGSEIVVRDGKYFTVDSPTRMDLKKGDIIFNHKQTKAILKNGKKSVIDKLNEKGQAVYSKLTGSSFATGTMSKNVFDALINGLSNTVGSFVSVPNYGARFAQYAPGYAGGQSMSISIGDIHVHGVENVNGLSQEIINRLPNTLLQKLSK